MWRHTTNARFAIIGVSALVALALGIPGNFARLSAQDEKLERLLIVSSVDKGFAIHVINFDGTGHKRLTESKDPMEMDPVWSPDRKRIVFVSFDKETKTGDLYVVNADGANLKKLTKLDGETRAMFPCWSPDGKQIAFTAIEKGGDDAKSYVTDAEGKEVKRLAQGAFSVWSPDGKSIAYMAADKEKQKSILYSADAGGKNSKELGSGYFPQWAPDGKKILYLLRGKSPFDQKYLVMDADGKNSREVGQPPTRTPRYGPPSWSPDSKRIAYEGEVGGEVGIYIVNADGTETKLLRKLKDNPDKNEHESDPVWSADGSKLYFNGLANRTKTSGVYGIGADGKNVKLLTPKEGMHLLGERSSWLVMFFTGMPF